MTIRTFTSSGLGIVGTNEPFHTIQYVTVTGSPTGGTFTLTLSGQTTSTIAYNATPAAVEAALAALSNVGVGNVCVAGVYTNKFVVTFQGALFDVPQAAMTINVTGLTGGTPVGTITAQVAGHAGVEGTAVTGFASPLTLVQTIPPAWVPQYWSMGPFGFVGQQVFIPATGQLWPRGSGGVGVNNPPAWPGYPL